MKTRNPPLLYSGEGVSSFLIRGKGRGMSGGQAGGMA